MDLLLPIGFGAGYVILMLALRRERQTALDAFGALSGLRRFGVMRPPTLYTLSAILAFLGGALGVEGSVEARLAVGALPALVVWVAWLHVWVGRRALLDAAIVFQDHIPPAARPAQAFSPAPYAALSFRPFRSAALLLAALTLVGVALGWGSQLVGAEVTAVVGAVTYALIGLTFAALVKRALTAERAFRHALVDSAGSTDDQILEALRRNPRSSTLLEAHADRLAAKGHAVQALLQYKAAQLDRPSEIRLMEKTSVLRDALPRRGDGPPRGAIVQLPGEPEPRMQLDPLDLATGAPRVRPLDVRGFVRELLAMPDEGLILAVQGNFDEGAAEQLEAFRHLSPLVTRSSGVLAPFFGAWRLDPEVRTLLAAYVLEHDIQAEWSRFALYTLDQLLVEAHGGFAVVMVDPGLYEREYIEWRRAAVVAADAG